MTSPCTTTVAAPPPLAQEITDPYAVGRTGRTDKRGGRSRFVDGVHFYQVIRSTAWPGRSWTIRHSLPAGEPMRARNYPTSLSWQRCETQKNFRVRAGRTSSNLTKAVARGDGHGINHAAV